MTISTTRVPESDDRNETVLAMLDEVRPMLWSFVLKYRLEFEEAYQHAAWLMLETWHKLPADCTNVKAYLNATVRRGLYHMLKKNIEYDNDALSLESCTKGGMPLADTLEATESCRTEAELQRVEAEEHRSKQVVEVVHSALRECRTEEQEYVRRVYRLVDYTPVVNERLAYRSKQVKQDRNPRSIRRSVNGVLRKNPQVLALVQREKCIL
jgi:hypothetical protein